MTTKRRAPRTRAAKAKKTKLALRIFVLGRGKVGVALARAARALGAEVTLRAARAGLPRKPIDVDLLILAVRDRDLTPLAEALAEGHLVTKKTACVHVAGALGPAPLASLRAVSAGVAQMHPMISFASREKPPRLERGNVHIQGDRVAAARARTFARALGMTPRTFASLDTIAYHAAAGLVANGAAALAAVGVEVLARAGIPRETAPLLLGPLLRSVADNVEVLGFPEALTGPVRRGDPSAVRRHLEMFQERLPDAVPLFVASGLGQLPLARALGEAPAEGFDQIEALLRGVKIK